MRATGMHATLAIWLVAAMAAVAAGQAVQSSSFNFPFSMYFLQTAAAWAIARAAVLVLNLQLDMGEPAQHAAARSQDAEPSKQQQLMFAGLLLGGSMTAQALVQTFEASSSPATAVFKCCTPILVLAISLFMRLHSPRPLWSTLPVLLVCAGTVTASYEGGHIFQFWQPASPFLQATVVFLQAGSICLLQKALQPRTDTLPHALSGRTSSSGSSLLRTSSSASTSSRTSSSSSSSVTGDDDVVTPSGPSPLAVLTHTTWYAMLVLAAPVILLEAPRLITTFAGWRHVLPTLLANCSTFTLYSLLTVAAVRLTSALAVSTIKVVTATAVSLATALIYPLHSNFPAGVIRAMQWQGFAASVLGLVLYAWAKVAAQRAVQLQLRSSLEAPAKNAAYWALEDPAKVMKCSGADVLVYIQPHRVRQVSAAPWVQAEGFKPVNVVQDVAVPQTPGSHMQLPTQQYQMQHQHQQQLVYC